MYAVNVHSTPAEIMRERKRETEREREREEAALHE
jgi:hypothetical protein